MEQEGEENGVQRFGCGELAGATGNCGGKNRDRGQIRKGLEVKGRGDLASGTCECSEGLAEWIQGQCDTGSCRMSGCDPGLAWAQSTL